MVDYVGLLILLIWL